MPSKQKKGFILIPLIVLLLLSFCTLALSKFFSTSQANVETAISSRYQTSLSKHIDTPDQWKRLENKEFKFAIYYPSQWVGAQSKKSTGSEIFVLERFLSDKIILKVTVFSDYKVPDGLRAAKFNDNTFTILEDSTTKKSAVQKNGKLYYLIELAQDNYFADETEFKGQFFLLLKKFELI